MVGASETNRRFVVTGATGYLGPWLAREIVHEFGPKSLTCLIAKVLPPIERKSLAYLQRLGVECLECDLMKRPVLPLSLPGVDVLIHMAANTRTDLPERDLQVNTVGTTNLIETFSDSLRGKRLLLTSTSAAVDRDRAPREPLREDSPARPRTAYGRTKLKAEAIVREKAGQYGFDYTIVRLTTLYGPGMRGGLFRVLADWASQGRFLGRINWPGRASFIFVEDAARIVTWFSYAEAGRNRIYFMTSGETYTIGKLAEAISAARANGQSTVRLPGWVWRAVQRLIWLPGINQLVPWRLANVLDDSLLCDSSRMQAVYPGRLTALDAGLSRTFGKSASEDEIDRALA